MVYWWDIRLESEWGHESADLMVQQSALKSAFHLDFEMAEYLVDWSDL